MMDLVDLLVEKRFLGQEFLTWLWFASERRGGMIDVPGVGDIVVVFEKHLLLEYGEGDSFEKLICQGLQAELIEARTGLKMGKKLEQARILLARGDYEWNLTLKGSTFDFKSVKTPKTMATAEEAGDSAAVEGRILEKVGFYEEALHLIDEMFRMFLKLRVSEEWQTELVAVQEWVKRDIARI